MTPTTPNHGDEARDSGLRVPSGLSSGASPAPASSPSMLADLDAALTRACLAEPDQPWAAPWLNVAGGAR